MNRKETQLLVENWRKVLDEGLYDHDPEILEEINLKNLSLKYTPYLLAALSFAGALTPNQASAKFTNIDNQTQTRALRAIERAIQEGKLDKSKVESLIKLGALIQADENFVATRKQKKLVDDFADDFIKLLDNLVDQGMAKKEEVKAAEAHYEEHAARAGIDMFDPGLKKATAKYENGMDDLRDILDRIKDLDSISNHFNFETKKLPDGFEEIYSMVDKATGKVKAGGSRRVDDLRR